MKEEEKEVVIENAVIKNATIISSANSAERENFYIVLIIFAVGVLSTNLALQYSEFITNFIKRVSFKGDSIIFRLLNLAIITTVSISVLYLVWKRVPDVRDDMV